MVHRIGRRASIDPSMEAAVVLCEHSRLSPTSLVAKAVWGRVVLVFGPAQTHTHFRGLCARYVHHFVRAGTAI